jgi:hypothetical protein
MRLHANAEKWLQIAYELSSRSGRSERIRIPLVRRFLLRPYRRSFRLFFKHGFRPILRHRSITISHVQVNKPPDLDERQYSAPHQLADHSYVAPVISGDFSFGFPVHVALCCHVIIHTVFVFGMVFQAGGENDNHSAHGSNARRGRQIVESFASSRPRNAHTAGELVKWRKVKKLTSIPYCPKTRRLGRQGRGNQRRRVFWCELKLLSMIGRLMCYRYYWSAWQAG